MAAERVGLVPEAIGCVWTVEFHLNTLRVNGEIFESGTKKLRIQKYLEACGWSLKRDFDLEASQKISP